MAYAARDVLIVQSTANLPSASLRESKEAILPSTRRVLSSGQFKFMDDDKLFHGRKKGGENTPGGMTFSGADTAVIRRERAPRAS